MYCQSPQHSMRSPMDQPSGLLHSFESLKLCCRRFSSGFLGTLSVFGVGCYGNSTFSWVSEWQSVWKKYLSRYIFQLSSQHQSEGANATCAIGGSSEKYRTSDVSGKGYWAGLPKASRRYEKPHGSATMPDAEFWGFEPLL